MHRRVPGDVHDDSHWSKNDRVVKLLLENGGDISMSADTGGPMRAAVVEGHEPTVCLLVELERL